MMIETIKRNLMARGAKKIAVFVW